MQRNSDNFIKLISAIGRSDLHTMLGILEEDLTVLEEISLDNMPDQAQYFYEEHPSLLISGLTPLHFAVFTAYIDDGTRRLIGALKREKPELGDKKGHFLMTPNELEAYLAPHVKEQGKVETLIIDLINRSKIQGQDERELIGTMIDDLIEKHHVTQGQWKTLILTPSIELEVGISRFSQNRAIAFKNAEYNCQIELKDGQLIVLDKNKLDENKKYTVVTSMTIQESIFKQLLSTIRQDASNKLKNQFIEAYDKIMKSEQNGVTGFLFGGLRNYQNNKDKTLEEIFFYAFSGKGGGRSRAVIEKLWFAKDEIIKLTPLQIEIIDKAIQAVNEVRNEKIPLILDTQPCRDQAASSSSPC